MGIATFQKYKNGYYTFLFDDGTEVDFEEISPKALYKYKLNTDNSFVDKDFKLTFSEVISKITDDTIYRIDSLLLL
ncbi:hypothetical protein [Changchengzhania lutea]|uniref:hypothetical protein n=1 Tax=Changchengzhania lutea TaxID=2049305 RepID=UPI00115C5CA5|nr:hypothetical protein [Changchengzhania lutea]